MKITDWRSRLKEAMATRGFSKRGLSLAANMSSGYIHGILVEGKDPSIDNLTSICEALGVSLIWMLYGYKIDREAEKLLRIWEDQPHKRAAILQLLDPTTVE